MAALCVFGGAVASNFGGFGFSAAAGAVLLHWLDPLEVVPLMMACSLMTQGMARLRATSRLRDAVPFCSGGLAGLAVALPALPRIDGATFRPVFGAFLVLCGASTSCRVRMPDVPLRSPNAWPSVSSAARTAR